MEISKDRPNLIVNSLKEVLTSLSQNSCQHIENPGALRRASVALIIRIRPNFSHWPGEELNKTGSHQPFDLTKYFATSWVQYGDPEILFIKRAARQGDRWTSHVALPGGKRDPDDEDDKSVAIRETAEEIGLDLTSLNAFYIGNLPERLILTALGTIPIIILCPFIFLWTEAVLPPLRLQPEEVASAHWVPLRILLSPSSRSFEYVNASDRLMQRRGLFSKYVLQSLLGSLKFSAIKLSPSESLFCSSSEEFFPKENLIQLQPEKSLITRFYHWCFSKNPGGLVKDTPLLLWGLTLGILVDFLHQFPPHNATELWSYPTFTNYDARLIVSVMTKSLRRRNKDSLKLRSCANLTAIDNKAEAVHIDDSSCIRVLGDVTETSRKPKCRKQVYIVGILLDGYYDILRRGAVITIILKTTVILTLVCAILRRYKKKAN